MEAKADYVFEICYEACNKVGGIYTVVKSKAAGMKSYYKNYFLVGPYYADRLDLEFEEHDAPDVFKDKVEYLKEEGIVCHFGTWHISGKPDVISVDFSGYHGKADELKPEYWDKYSGPHCLDSNAVLFYGMT